MLLVKILLTFIAKGLCNDIEIKYVKKGQDVFLECPVTYPTGAKSIDVRWKRKQWKSTIYAHSQESLDKEYIAPFYEGRLLRSSGATLKLRKIQSNDQDMFTCEVSFNFEKAVSTSKYSEVQQSSIFLIVNEQPVIIDISARNFIAKPGENVSLFCKVQGQPLPTVRWFKNNQPLPIQEKPISHEQDISIREKSTKQYVFIPKIRNIIWRYNISNINHGHSGEYKCIATNSEGTAQESIYLIVKGRIYFIEKPSDKTVELGQTVEFNCKATGNPNNITYYWLKNNQPIEMIINLQKRYQILKFGSLRIISVEPYDSGIYMCIPSNGVEYQSSYSSQNLDNVTLAILRKLKADVFSVANITVYFRPIPHPIDQPIYLAINSKGFLPCSLTANPYVKRIYWKKEGNNQEIYSSVTGLLVKKSLDYATNLTIMTFFHEWDSVTKEDSGLYRCHGFNLMGHGDWSNIIQVITKKSPFFVTRPHSMYTVTSGQSVSITCQAHGDPVPQITWLFKNGTKIPSEWEDRKDNGVLVIGPVTKLHQNIYFCKAKNAVKTIVAKTEIVVKDQREKDFGFVNVSAACRMFSATVSWFVSSPIDSQLVTTVLFKLSSSSHWKKRNVFSPFVTHQTILGLLPDEEYQFSISFKIQNHQNFLIPTAICRTLGYRDDLVKHLPTDDKNNIIFPAIVKQLGPTPDPPINVVVNLTHDNKISIYWNPPDNTSWPPILYYRVEYSEILVRNSQPYNNFKLLYPKTASIWHQLEPVSFPTNFYILHPTSITKSVSILNGLVFRVRSYALLSVSGPSQSVPIDRSLIDMLLIHDKDKVDLERSVSNLNNLWPVIFWSLISLVFSSIVVLCVLIVFRKCNLSYLWIRDEQICSSNPKLSTLLSANPSLTHDYVIDAVNDSLIVINNHSEIKVPNSFKIDNYKQGYGDYVKITEISREPKNKTPKIENKLPNENKEYLKGLIAFRKPSTSTSSADQTRLENDTNALSYCSLVRTKNDVNLYCNCHTYSPNIVVRNQLSQSKDQNMITEL